MEKTNFKLLKCSPGAGTHYTVTFEGSATESTCDLITSEEQCRHASSVNKAFDKNQGYSGNGTLALMPAGCVHVLPGYFKNSFEYLQPHQQYIFNVDIMSTTKSSPAMRSICSNQQCETCPLGSYSSGGVNASCTLCPKDRPFTNFRGSEGARSISACTNVQLFWFIYAAVSIVFALLTTYAYFKFRKWLERRYNERLNSLRRSRSDDSDDFERYTLAQEFTKEHKKLNEWLRDEERIRREERERCKEWLELEMIYDKQEDAFQADKYAIDIMCKSMKANENIPPHFICPINKEIMIRPVFASDGYTYEADAIEKWFDATQTTARSPITNLPLTDTILIPNYGLRSMIYAWKGDMISEQMQVDAKRGSEVKTGETEKIASSKYVFKKSDT